MATKLNDGITAVVEKKQVVDEVPRVRVMIPKSIDSESGLKSDPYEHVTINGEPPVFIERGVWVDVTVPVYMQLRNRYQNI